MDCRRERWRKGIPVRGRFIYKTGGKSRRHGYLRRDVDFLSRTVDFLSCLGETPSKTQRRREKHWLLPSSEIRCLRALLILAIPLQVTGILLPIVQILVQIFLVA